MDIRRFSSSDGKRLILGYVGEDAEYVNPMVLHYNDVVKTTMDMEKQLMAINFPEEALQVTDDYFYHRADEFWKEQYKLIMETELHENFLTLLLTKTKKDQIK